MKDRTSARKFSFQFFYHFVFSNEEESFDINSLENEIQLFSESLKYPASENQFVHNLLQTSLTRYNEVNNLISKHLTKSKIDSISKSLLVLAVTEMNFLEEKVPGKVVINEYVEMAKEFGTKETKSFINGVLDKIYNELSS